MKIILIFILSINLSSLYSQGRSYDLNDPSFLKNKIRFAERQKKIDSLSQADLYGYNYKYLDRNFKIILTQKLFRKALINQGYNPRVRLKRKDSLSIVLYKEFDDKEVVNIALQRVFQTWENVARHLDYSIAQTKKLAYNLDLKYPDQLYRFLIGDTQLYSIKCQNIKEQERNRVAQILSLETKTPREEYIYLSDAELFTKLYKIRKR